MMCLPFYFDQYVHFSLISIIRKKEQEDGEKERPLVLVISESSEMLNQAKERISSEYKGVYLKTTAQAKKYLEKHGAP